MKAQKTFAYQKFAVHSRQHARVTVVWRVSGTHKAQEIKAVNKGPSDKGSPDSYESSAGRGLAAGSFRMRADRHEKTNHSDEHEGHHLHLALPIHTNTHLFLSLPFAIFIPSCTSVFLASYFLLSENLHFEADSFVRVAFKVELD